ncbi:ankyrin protein [Fusarium bulbicola]|nr:ankyrin protein [Fusarium bulbicola]
MERVASQRPGHKELAVQVLSWITCAKRPLNVKELRHALAIEVGTEELNMDAMPDTDIMLQVYIRLVTIDKSLGIIRLVHYTTQDYIDKTRKTWFPKAECSITTTCVTYLNLRTFRSEPPNRNSNFKELTPLRLYAADNWAFHARNAGAICEGVVDFLESNPNVASSAQVCMRPELAIWASEGGEDVERRASGLHLAAFFGAIAETRVLLFTSDVELKEGYGRTAIFYAVRTGREAVISLLLDRGAKPDLQDNGENTPLSLATAYGHEGCTKLLLENGVKTDTADYLRRTSLVYASED